ncbi:MAG: EamA family transporter RarD [Rhizobiaceae bacterium]
MDPATRGFLFALASYLLWGFLPLYLKLMGHIPIGEFIAHRAIWSLAIATMVVLWLGRAGEIGRVLSTPRMLAMGFVTSAIISVNWLTYVWAIGEGRALEAALGYYINPLCSVFLAALLLGERLERIQWVAIALAVVGVAILAVESGGLPWPSIVLAVSWAFYALFKKTLPIGSVEGFLLEVLILSGPALAYIVWMESSGTGHFGHTGWGDVALLMSAGLATSVPLILYASGAKLMRLSTIGIMQYIAPTIIFLIAVFVFGEPFGRSRLIAFLFIWGSLAIYTWSMLRKRGPGVPVQEPG